MKKIAFIWYFKQASTILPLWRDGLRAAMELVAKEHQVDWFMDEKLPYPEDDFDWLLFWGDSDGPFFDYIDQYKCKKGLFLSTMPHNISNLQKLDVIWCESQPVLEMCLKYKLPAVMGFGTDTNFFCPDENVVKDIEYFTIGTFSPWKRQDLLAPLGNKLVALGSVQPDGKDILKICQDAGVKCITNYVPAEEVLHYYRRARNIILSGVHGSERSVVESFAVGMVPRVLPHNPKTESYIKEFIDSPYICPRDFVVDRYSAKKYAESILKGLQE